MRDLDQTYTIPDAERDKLRARLTACGAEVSTAGADRVLSWALSLAVSTGNTVEHVVETYIAELAAGGVLDADGEEAQP